MTHREVWRDIDGWPRHQVSSLGRVRVLLGGKIRGRVAHKIEMRKQTLMTVGYLTVGHPQKLVHRLVLAAFRGPANGRHCRHLDGDGTNNRLSNLRWGTRAENEADKIAHGRTNRGERNGNAKLSLADIDAIRTAVGPRGIVTRLAEQYGVTHPAISMIRSSRRWSPQKEHEHGRS